MQSSLVLKILVATVVLSSAVVGFVQYRKTGGDEKASHEPVVFQPDSQILNQAVDSTRAEATNKSDTIPDRPINAKGSSSPYIYKSDVCKDNSAYLCFSQYYKTLVSDYGVSTASADINKRSQENSLVLSQCHPLMHVIGRSAVGSYKTISEVFAHGDAFCWSGYYHGVMEGMIANIGLPNLSKGIDTICADIPGKEKYTFDYFNCVHGLGHGIMALLEDEVFDSLKMCDNLSGWWERESCYSGVFMQNIIDSTNIADTGGVLKYLKPAEPLYPCDVVEIKYKGQCYLGQTSYALQVTGYDFKKVFEMCTKVEQPYRDICNQSMGRDVANQAHHEKYRTRDWCLIPADQNDVANCVIGAAKEIISYYHSDKEALEFCIILDDENKTICIDITNSYYKNF